MILINELIEFLTFLAKSMMPERGDLLSSVFTICEIEAASKAIAANSETYRAFCCLRQQSKEAGNESS